MAGGRDLPARRRLRVFALDPSLDRATATVDVARLVLSVPWDRADGRNGPLPGPVGEYLEVCDVDPASGCWYEPLDLMDPAVLAEDGLEPSTADPQFHQQMVYAVAMTTIEHFEHALGRRAMWADRGDPPPEESAFVPRLRIYPHAFRGENAYYSPRKACG